MKFTTPFKPTHRFKASGVEIEFIGFARGMGVGGEVVIYRNLGDTLVMLRERWDVGTEEIIPPPIPVGYLVYRYGYLPSGGKFYPTYPTSEELTVGFISAPVYLMPQEPMPRGAYAYRAAALREARDHASADLGKEHPLVILFDHLATAAAAHIQT